MGWLRQTIVAICWETLEDLCFLGFSCNLEPQKLKYMHVTISCMDGHPRKFIRKKLQDDQTSKILYVPQKFSNIRYIIGNFIKHI